MDQSNLPKLYFELSWSVLFVSVTFCQFRCRVVGRCEDFSKFWNLKLPRPIYRMPWEALPTFRSLILRRFLGAPIHHPYNVHCPKTNNFFSNFSGCSPFFPDGVTCFPAIFDCAFSTNFQSCLTRSARR